MGQGFHSNPKKKERKGRGIFEWKEEKTSPVVRKMGRKRVKKTILRPPLPAQFCDYY